MPGRPVERYLFIFLFFLFGGFFWGLRSPSAFFCYREKFRVPRPAASTRVDTTAMLNKMVPHAAITAALHNIICL